MIFRRFHTNGWKPPWNLLFFGNDQFSLYTLVKLYKELQTGHLIQSLNVVTSSTRNPVYSYCQTNRITTYLWPNYTIQRTDVGVVVSFGHLLPAKLIEALPMGMINVHGSLLPKYRGASPIIHALAKGDRTTGVTIMRIRPKRFDIGEILWQKSIEIDTDIMQPTLHRQLGVLGANGCVEVLQNLRLRLELAEPQPTDGVSYAPKIKPSFALIDWSAMTARDIYNRYRALYGIRPVHTYWDSDGAALMVKLLKVTTHEEGDSSSDVRCPGYVHFDKLKNRLIIQAASGSKVTCDSIGVQGKPKMTATDFYNGYMSKRQPVDRVFVTYPKH